MNYFFFTFLIFAFVSLDFPHSSQAKISKKLDKKLCECETYKPRIKGRIVGGKGVNKNDFKYTVSLFVKYQDDNFEHLCTGVIVNPMYVLSAAYCIDRKFLSNDSAFVGGGINHDLMDIYASPANYRKIEKIHTHPSLKELKTKIEDVGEDYYTTNDVTLYGLDSPLELGPKINLYPACLLNFHKHDFEETLYVTSWGMRNSVIETIRKPRMIDEISSNQQKNKIKIILDIGSKKNPMTETQLSMAEMKQANKSHYQSFGFDPQQFIISTSESSSVCRGDKGSPLATNINNKLLVIGLVTMMDSKNDTDRIYHCFPGSLSFSTPVSNYTDWLNTIVGTNLC